MTMLQAPDVIAKLKEIGPHVFYEANEAPDGRWVHKFRVQDRPVGAPRHIALLAVLLDTKNLIISSDEIDMAEGRKRYQNG